MLGNEGFGDLSDLARPAEGGKLVEDFRNVVGEGGRNVLEVNSCVPCSAAKLRLDP
jgi:hypothetical protein